MNTATGAIAQRLDYDEYGRVTNDTDPGFQPFGYTGGLYDHRTKLVHLGARDYDPETGRWLTSDPIGFNGGDTNLYAYVGNDPINYVDIAGTFKFPSAQDISDAAAGYGDAATGGLTKKVRQALGVDGSVDYCSGAYGVGEALSATAPTPGGKAAIASKAGAAAATGVRGRGKLGPDPLAQGLHTRIKREGRRRGHPTEGRVEGYSTFDDAGREKKRFRGVGKPHGDQQPPIVYDNGGRARPARPDELPNGY